MKNTNIYKISDIQKVYKCSYSEAFKARHYYFLYLIMELNLKKY